MQKEKIQIKLLITRHGETEQNRAHMICGQKPGTLTGEGIEQAKKIGKWFHKQQLHFNKIYVSDLKRTKDTFQNIKSQANHLKNIQTIFTQLLREKCGGILQGKPLKAWKEQADKEKKTIRAYKCKNSQSWEDVNVRSQKFLQKMIEDILHQQKLKQFKQAQETKQITQLMENLEIKQNNFKVLAVSHGGFIMQFHNVVRVLTLNQKPIFDNKALNCSFHEFIIEYPLGLKKYDPKQVKIKCVNNNFVGHLQ